MIPAAPRPRAAARLLLGAGLVFGAGLVAGRALAPRAPCAAHAHDPALTPPPPAIDTAALTAAVRAEVHRAAGEAFAAQLAAVRAAGAAAASERREPPTEPQPLPEQLTARAEAERLLARARSARAWRQADAEAFRSLRAQAAPADAHHLAQLLAQAINRDELLLEFAGPPF